MLLCICYWRYYCHKVVFKYTFATGNTKWEEVNEGLWLFHIFHSVTLRAPALWLKNNKMIKRTVIQHGETIQIMSTTISNKTSWLKQETKWALDLSFLVMMGSKAEFCTSVRSWQQCFLVLTARVSLVTFL